jgi:ABC-type antimicrobial peptide transport system permease subunit
VAAVVGLRSLALMIGDELTLNLAELNRGDVQIVASDDLNPRYVQRSRQNDTIFTPAGVAAIREWAADNQAEVQFASSDNLLQMTPVNENGQLGAPISLIPFLVEPEHWPYYGQVVTSEPANLSLAQAFALAPYGVVMSGRLALDNSLQVGDSLRVGGSETLFTIVALVDDQSEGSFVLRNGPAGLIGFIYYPLFRADELGLDPLPQRAFVKLPLGTNIGRIENSLKQRFGEDVALVTTDELAEENQRVSDLINDLILVMGLSSILIGGMGIINTMNVTVSRRMLEIAVLKTLGLKAWRVTLLFLTEAVLMGLVGSLVGVLGGIGLSVLIRDVGEAVLNTELAWRPYPEAWFSGATLGLVITICFGFLPTLNAGQVRPIGVLRPNDIQLPTAGLTRTLGALIFTLVVFGLTLNTVVEGQIQLPISLGLGLGGFIVGLFGGIMLANEGVMNPIPPDASLKVARRGVKILAAGVAALSLLGLVAVNLLFALGLPAPLIYALPVALGVALYAGLKAFSDERPRLAINSARLARQVLLIGGAVVLGGGVAAGFFILMRAVSAALYPNIDPPPGLRLAGLVSMTIGLLSAALFRWRGRQAASVAGLALISGAALSVVCFGVGDALNALFDGTPFWDAVESLTIGIIVVELIALALGGMFALLNGVVWLLGKTPTFHNVDLKLIFRNIRARRARTASTMIGLITGIGALSLITLTTSGVTGLLEGQLETDIGGNIVVLSRDLPTAEAVRKRLDNTIPGVESYIQLNFYQGRILSVDGDLPKIEGIDFGDRADGNRFDFGQREGEEGIGFGFITFDPRAGAPPYRMKAGRNLTPDDIGQRVMIIREPPQGSLFDQLNVQLGSEVLIRVPPPLGSKRPPLELTFTVVGIIDRNSEQGASADTLQAPVGVLPDDIQPNSIFTVVQVEEASLDIAMVEFAQISNAFALEIGFLVQLIEQLLEQLIAIPALVATLALVAGVAIIANTVALDTQERRRQIGVMKAVGLKGYRVLGQLMFENAFIGLVSGLIGVGIGLVATLLVGVLGDAERLEETLDLAPALRLILTAVAISSIATLVSAWTAARESPMNVLRYE